MLGMIQLPMIWLLLIVPSVSNETTKPEIFSKVFQAEQECIDVVARALPRPGTLLQCVAYTAVNP